jgi:predicted HD phosphohydrolase
MTASFRRMDQASAADWDLIQKETWRHQPRVADRVLAMLESLASIEDGFPVNQLTHALQTASRAEEAGAGEELILAGLCHDLGKAISVWGHSGISAAILRPYVSADVAWMVESHQLIQGRHYPAHFREAGDQWKKLTEHPFFPTAWRFVEEWDQVSFDPEYPTPSIERYEPLVREWFAKPLFKR